MIDYYAIEEAIRTIFVDAAFTYEDRGTTLPLRPESILIEAMDREIMALHLMPLMNIRLTEGVTSLITIPNGYYAETQVEVDVISYDLSEFRKAARVRDNLMKAAMLRLRAIPNLNNSDLVQSSKIGQNINFSAGTPEQGGGHIAIGTFRVLTESYVDFP
jgi:hypothetical protein